MLMATLVLTSCNAFNIKLVTNGFNTALPAAPVVTLASGSPTASIASLYTVSSCLDFSQIFVSESLVPPLATDVGWQSCSTVAAAHNYSLSPVDGWKQVYIYGLTNDQKVSNPATVPVRLLSASATLAWSPLDHDFSYVKLNTESDEQIFTFSNNGLVDAVICTAPTLTNNTNFTITEDNCGTSDLLASQSCDVKVSGASSTEGTFATTLKRECFNSGGEVTTTLNDIKVSAIADTTMSWSPLTKNFGNIYLGYSSPGDTFTLNNTGAKDAVLCQPPVLSNSTDFVMVMDGCQNTNVSSMNDCAVMVQAKPQTVGVRQTTLSRSCLNISGGVVSTTALGITVTGLTPIPQFSTNMTSINFGNIRSGRGSFEREVFYMNKGNGTATGCGNAYLTNTSDFQIVSNDCAAGDILPGESCRVVVRGLSSTMGARSGNLERLCTTGGLLATSLSVNVETPTIYPVKVVSGQTGSCAILSNKTAKCWGNFGYSTAPTSSVPALLTFGSTLTDIVDLGFAMGGVGHACGLFDDGNMLDGGDVKCWGYNYDGQVGNSESLPGTSASTPALATTGAIKIVLSSNHTCALLANQTVKCWGDNTLTKLGFGTGDQSVPGVIPGITTAIDISANYYHTCVLLSNQTVQCFGNYTAAATGLTQVESIVSAHRSTCALLTNKTIRCWGEGGSGELGNSASSNSFASTVAVTGINDAVKLVAGMSNYCAQMTDLSYRCWGLNDNGQLGNGTISTHINSPVSLSVVNNLNINHLGLGARHTCALMNNESINCWGQKSNNALGSNELLYKMMPVKLNTPTNLASIAVSFGDTFAVDGNGLGFQWGSGYNPFPAYSELPIGGTILDNLSFVSGVNTIRCGIKPDATPLCAGNDTVLTPVLGSISGAKKIVTTTNSSVAFCVLKLDKTVSCLGANTNGQVGNGTTTTQTSLVDIGLSDVEDIVSGPNQFCSIHTDKTIKCWGENTSGGLGLGVENGSYWTPTNSLITNATKVSLGHVFGCAILIDKTVKCWGANTYGQLGDGTNTKKLIPTLVSGLSDVEDIVASWSSVCALLTNGLTKCWGSNNVGQLGDGTIINRNVPVTSFVKLDSLALQVSGYDVAMCGINASKEAYCWGNDAKGQLGNYTRPAPARSVTGF